MDSLQVTDAQSRAVAVAPRVSLDDIKAAIRARYDLTADQAVVGADWTTKLWGEMPAAAPGTENHIQLDRASAKAHTAYWGDLRLLSICILVMQNGFVVIGKAAPASAENFNPELGKQFAYEDAVRQLWPLMGFALRDKLAGAA